MWPPTSGPTPGRPHGEAAPGRDPHARRLARRQPGPPPEPRGCGPGAEARSHQGRDAGSVSGRGEEASRDDRHECPGRAPEPGAALGDALQLRAGECGVGDAAAGLLRAGEPGLAQAPREGWEAARRPGSPPGGGGARRLPPCRTAGVDAVNLYRDCASGLRDDRPGVDSCLRALRKGDVLVVWKLDRLGRNLVHPCKTVGSPFWLPFPATTAPCNWRSTERGRRARSRARWMRARWASH